MSEEIEAKCSCCGFMIRTDCPNCAINRTREKEEERRAHEEGDIDDKRKWDR